MSQKYKCLDCKFKSPCYCEMKKTKVPPTQCLFDGENCHWVEDEKETGLGFLFGDGS